MAEKYNDELYHTFNEPDIGNYIKVKILAWAGHIVYMNNDRTLKEIFNTKPEGERNAERQTVMGE